MSQILNVRGFGPNMPASHSNISALPHSDAFKKATVMKFVIEKMRQRDWGQVRAIYSEGLATGVAAFMSNPPIWKDWDRQHLTIARFVARTDENTLQGWSALAPVADN